MGFDPIQYKTTTRQQWEDAAEVWHRCQFETGDGFVGPCELLAASGTK